MTTTTPRDRVLAGAAWLDERVPDWRDRVTLPDLRMDDTCRCVLGQVFQREARAAGVDVNGHGDAYAFWYMVELSTGEVHFAARNATTQPVLTPDQAIAYGFDRMPWEDEYELDGEDFTDLPEGWDPTLDYEELRQLWAKVIAREEI